jgi:hypothetical protein
MKNTEEMPLKSKFVDIEYKGDTYNIEFFYYESPDGHSFTTTTTDAEFFDRLDQLHRDRKIQQIIQK